MTSADSQANIGQQRKKWDANTTPLLVCNLAELLNYFYRYSTHDENANNVGLKSVSCKKILLKVCPTVILTHAGGVVVTRCEQILLAVVQKIQGRTSRTRFVQRNLPRVSPPALAALLGWIERRDSQTTPCNSSAAVHAPTRTTGWLNVSSGARYPGSLSPSAPACTQFKRTR